MLPTLTCTKMFADIPFAHRQHNHTGHCRFIHGHNWSFLFTFAANKLDANGFIIDFGGAEMKELKRQIEQQFDHKLLVNADDPERPVILAALDCTGLAAAEVVDDASCEGIAAFLLNRFGNVVYLATAGRVNVVEVTVYEDSKNSATAKL